MTGRRALRLATIASTVVVACLLAPSAASAWSPRYQAVDFISASRGWVAGLGSTIIRTTNGGKTWTVQKKASATAPTINDVCFRDKLHGWAVGNAARLYRTTNGGRTWRRVTSPAFPATDDFFAVKFVSASKGWIVGGVWSNLYDSGNTPHGELLVTTDGGRTWAATWNSVAACYTGFDMVNGTTGVLVGRARMQISPSTGYDAPFFMTTTDGWSTLSHYTNLGSTTVTSSVADVDMVAGGRIVLVGSYNDMEPFTPFIFSSPDGGTSWDESSPPFGPLRPQAVKMTTSLVGYAVGFDDPSVYKTVGGGSTWTYKPTPYGKYLMDCDFVSSSTGYAVGAYGAAHSPLIIKTTNGARSWTRVK